MIKKRDGFSGERAIILPESVISQMDNNPLLKQLHITAIGYYPKAENHYRDRSIIIPQYVFIYCSDGEGWVEIEGKQNIIKANQFIIIPSNKRHRYGANINKPWTIYWLHYKGEMAHHYSEGLDSIIKIPQDNNSRIIERIEIFEEILNTLDRGNNRDNLQYTGSLLHHFLGTLRYIQQYRNAPKNGQYKDYDVVDTAIHYMCENIEKRITIGEIAQYMGYSQSHFSLLFHQRTGYSPTNYFNQLKIRKACEFLDFSDMKINQICYKIGISDTYYFSRLFKTIMNCSPREYRRNNKE